MSASARRSSSCRGAGSGEQDGGRKIGGVTRTLFNASYLGQELTARTHFRGVVRKRLVPVGGAALCAGGMRRRQRPHAAASVRLHGLRGGGGLAARRRRGVRTATECTTRRFTPQRSRATRALSGPQSGRRRERQRHRGQHARLQRVARGQSRSGVGVALCRLERHLGQNTPLSLVATAGIDDPLRAAAAPLVAGEAPNRIGKCKLTACRAVHAQVHVRTRACRPRRICSRTLSACPRRILCLLCCLYHNRRHALPAATIARRKSDGKALLRRDERRPRRARTRRSSSTSSLRFSPRCRRPRCAPPSQTFRTAPRPLSEPRGRDYPVELTALHAEYAQLLSTLLEARLGRYRFIRAHAGVRARRVRRQCDTLRMHILRQLAAVDDFLEFLR